MALLNSMTLHSSSMHRLSSGVKLEQHERDRVCSNVGCVTQLSRYNPAEVCCLHEGWNTATPVKRPRRR